MPPGGLVVTREGYERLFLALWPAHEARTRAAAQQAHVRGRHVPVQNLHVTLLFLGELPTARQSQLAGAFDDVRTGAFDIVLDRREVTRRGIAWLGMTSVPNKMRALHDEVSSVCESLGIELEQRPLRPHMTLARRARPQRPAIIEPIEWRVDAFTLVRSVRGEDGVYYESLREWALESD